METELKISGVGFPPFSARGCVQTLVPLKTQSFNRTINGELLYLGGTGFHKFKSTIVCEDLGAFSSQTFGIGQEVDVTCIQRLWHPFEGSEQTQELTLLRPAIPGSLIAKDDGLNAVEVTVLSDTQVRLMSRGPGHISYCPKLRMRIRDFSLKTTEWDAHNSWALSLEEI